MSWRYLMSKKVLLNLLALSIVLVSFKLASELLYPVIVLMFMAIRVLEKYAFYNEVNTTFIKICALAQCVCIVMISPLLAPFSMFGLDKVSGLLFNDEIVVHKEKTSF